MAVEEAIRTAGISPESVAFINAHGTGTPDNDRIESQLFNDTFPGTPFLSTKGYTGHTLGAAGAVEAAFTIAALERGRIPASAGFKTPDPDLPAHPADRPTDIRGPAALSQTLAFGGNNSVLIFGRAGEVFS
jgi:3-oxoacyl-[acyl-carrier-protein] synthase-1/3-oxoacyl-[acyl-carrier-protein] synthase II